MRKKKAKRPEVVMLEESCEYKLKKVELHISELRRDFVMLEARIMSYQQALIDAKSAGSKRR